MRRSAEGARRASILTLLYYNMFDQVLPQLIETWLNEWKAGLIQDFLKGGGWGKIFK